MADIIVMHAPRDRVAAGQVASSFPQHRVVTVPIIGRRAYYALGGDMVRVVLWSQCANSPRVAPAMAELLSESDDPAGLIVCDETPIPPAIQSRVSMQISMAQVESDPQACLSLVQAIVAKQAPQQSSAESSATRSRAGFAGRVVAVTGMAALSVAAVAAPRAPESDATKVGDAVGTAAFAATIPLMADDAVAATTHVPVSYPVEAPDVHGPVAVTSSEREDIEVLLARYIAPTVELIPTAASAEMLPVEDSHSGFSDAASGKGNVAATTPAEAAGAKQGKVAPTE